MPRMPRLEYSNAIYHIVARGDGRRRLFHDSGHYDRFTQGLVDEVDRSSAQQIIGIVAEHDGVDASGYREFRSPAGGRDLAAYLCRRYSGATLRELSIEFGLSHPDGSANLARRAKAKLKDSAELRKQCQQIERKLGLKTEDQV